MLNLLGILTAAAVAVYTMSYARYVWSKERNHMGAVALTVLALSVLALPVYILYFRH